MDLAAYEAEAAVEATHWWFAGRRELFAREIEEAGIPKSARILDVGTSTGTNLRMLRDVGYKDVTGLDFSADAIAFCASKGFGCVQQGDVCAMPFKDGSFDLILATDIIEHVEDDTKAAQEIMRVLKPGGKAIVTVPAFPFLWGLQDDVAQHKRRYRKPELLQVLQTAGLQTSHAYYFNYLLFVPIFVARQIIRLFRINLKTENDINGGGINAVLTPVFRFDIRSASRLDVPFGVSILALVEKPDGMERK